MYLPPNVQRVLERAATLWAATNETMLIETKERLQQEISDKQAQLTQIDADISVIAIKPIK